MGTTNLSKNPTTLGFPGSLLPRSLIPTIRIALEACCFSVNPRIDSEHDGGAQWWLKCLFSSSNRSVFVETTNFQEFSSFMLFFFQMVVL